MIHEQPRHNIAAENTNSSEHENKTVVSTLIDYSKIVLITFFAALVLKLFVVEAYRIPSMSMENTLQVGDFLLVNKLAYGLRTPHRIPFTAISLSSYKLPLFCNIHRGDVIVFEFPGNKNEVKPSESVNYIKRCVGLPGDTIEIRLGKVFVNGIETSFPLHGISTTHAADKTFRRNAELFPENSTFSDVNYGPIIIPKRGDVLEINSSTFSRWHIFIEREGHSIQINADTILIDGAATSSYRVQQNYYFVLGDNRDNSLDSRFWGFVPDDNLVGEAFFIYWSWNPEVPAYSIAEKCLTIKWNRIGTLIR